MNSKQKGKRGELELANKLKTFGYDTKRGQQYCGLDGSADVVGLKGIYIECKRVEALNIDKAIEQADKDHKDPDIPVVMHRKNGKEWKVSLYLTDFMDMYEKWVKEI